MKQLLQLISLLILTTQHSFGCLNYYHTIDKNGELHEEVDEHFRGFNKNFNYKLISSKLPGIEADFQDTKSPYVLSDYAVYLMKAGKVEESLALLIELNKNLPNEYQIAANLGTAYELVGELDSALFYINRGIAINPEAHGGSEWIHVRILETKLQLLENPNYLSDKSVLQLTSAQIEKTSTRYELEIQIRERFPFSPGPDQIMASLMIDLGDCYAANLSIEYAKAFYTIAEKYYGADPSTTAPKINEMIALRKEYKEISPPDQSGSDYSNLKISGVPYRSIIDDNNSNNYAITWSDFNLDTKALLAQVDYSVQNETHEHQTMDETNDPTSQPTTEEEPIKNIWIILILVGGIAICAGVIYIAMKIIS